MIRLTFTTLLMAIYFISVGQEIIVYSEKEKDNKVNIFATNKSELEHSIRLEASYSGMKPSDNLPLTKVIEPGSTAFLVSLTPTGNSSSYKYKYTYIMGDVTGYHDDNHIYQLPFKNGESYVLGQGYNEKPTHQNQYALDFNMPKGTEVCAIRNGRVIQVIDDFDKGCPRESCMKYNNFILIKHVDGSIADYSHLQQGGSLVEVGDFVKAGQPIALSGATGWASGPHLHLEVYLPQISGHKSIKARYHLRANKVGIPKSEEKYQQEL